MASFDILRRSRAPAADTAWKRTARWLRRRLPMGLYARSLLIVIIPMVLLQSVVAFVFMERHWQLVTQRLSAAVTGDIAAVIDLIDKMPASDYDDVIQIARDRLNLRISIEPDGELPAPAPKTLLRNPRPRSSAKRFPSRSASRSGSTPSAIPILSKSASSSMTSVS